MKFVEANKQKNNRGMALVSVLIVITLIGLLGSSILNLSYLAYQRKLVEKKNTENFYAAESVIDTVKAELQNLSTTAISSAKEGTGAFAEAAYEAVVGKDKDTATSADEAAVEAALFDVIIATDPDVAAALSGGTSEDGDRVGVDTLGATVTYSNDTEYTYTYQNDAGETFTATVEANGGLFEIGDIVIEDSCLRIEDVHVIYVNDEGYTSEITTDIVINAPVYAADEDVPLGTYSMFAGNGAKVSSTAAVTYRNGQAAFGASLYMHQDGNVYIGAQLNDDGSESTTAFEVIAGPNGGNGSTFISFGGTNIVFNGDVIVDDKNALIFTGGDGTETTNIQVNGYIVLKNGSSLFLPSNCNLVCKGIVTDIQYDSDEAGANVTSITYYEGTSAKSTASLFYPFTNNYVASSTSYTDEFLQNEGDVASVLIDVGLTTVSTSYCDSQYNNVMQDDDADGGVYIASTAYTSEGWNRKTSDVYNLLTCTVGSDSVWNWRYMDSNVGGNVTNITCDATDTKLDITPKVTYNDVVYDAEFAEIINIQLFSKLSSKVDISTYLVGYDADNDDTYIKVTWNEIAPSSERSTTNTTLMDLLGTKVNVYEDLWSWSSWVNWDDLYKLELDARDIVIPNATSLSIGDINYSNYTVTTTDGTKYSSQSDMMHIGLNSGAVNGQNVSNLLSVEITNNDFDVHVSGNYAGLFMSVKDVEFGANTGAIRGISLLELADETENHQGISDPNNEVRKYLEMLGTALLAQNGGSNSVMYNNSMLYEFALAENVFNGGIERFWSDVGTDDDDDEDDDKTDNSSLDFIDTENWSKD